MNVIVDTSVWSLALRRNTPKGTPAEQELAELIREGRVLMLGAIRQELLCGIRTTAYFQKLRDTLRAFPEVPLDVGDFENAAACFNRCRAKGLQGSNTDFLICAAAHHRNAAILSTDVDFRGFSRVLHLTLHEPR